MTYFEQLDGLRVQTPVVALSLFVFVRVVQHPTLFQNFGSPSLRVFDTLHDSHKRNVCCGIHVTAFPARKQLQTLAFLLFLSIAIHVEKDSRDSNSMFVQVFGFAGRCFRLL